MRTLVAISLITVGALGTARAGRPDETKEPELALAWASVQAGKHHLEAAATAHAAHGGLGGHDQKAIELLGDAEREIDQAVAFIAAHSIHGNPGTPPHLPALGAIPDDAKYPNLGEARLDLEQARRHMMNAGAIHTPTGGLGDHDQKLAVVIRNALKEVDQAERFSDAHP